MATDLINLTHQDINACIAEEVKGWSRPRIHAFSKETPIPACPNCGEWDYSNPPKAIEDWRSDYHWRGPTGTCWREPCHYTTDANADAEVRAAVREMEPKKQHAVTMAVISLTESRHKDSYGYYRMVYELPGDWAIACYAVLKGLNVLEVEKAICKGEKK